MNKEVLDDPGVYPPQEVKAKLVPDLADTEETTRLMTRGWTEVHDRQVSGTAATRRPRERREKGAVEGSTGAQPYIRIENVTKKFGDFVAVNDVSLNIYQGEIFCLLGGSGCGKTTLLRMLAGFEEPTRGPHLHRRRRTWPACRRTSARST